MPTRGQCNALQCQVIYYQPFWRAGAGEACIECLWYHSSVCGLPPPTGLTGDLQEE